MEIRVKSIFSYSTISFFVFTLIYFTASLVLLGSQYRPLSFQLIVTRYGLLALGLLILVFIYLIKNGLAIFRFPSRLSFYIFIIWIFFSVSVTISEVVHQTFPIQGLFFLLVVPFLYFTVMPYVTKLGGPTIHISLFTANFIYIVLSFIMVSINFLPYSGLAANPNGFGQLGAISSICGIFILLSLPKKRRLLKLSVTLFILLSLVSVFLSSSRTSFLVVGIVMFVLSLHYFISYKNAKPFLTILLIGLVGWLSPIKDMFLSGLYEKFTVFYEEGNLLNGRLGVWKQVIEEATLFGHGENYFARFIEGAHNSIIHILGVYGIIPALLLTAFLLFLMVIAYQHAIVNRQDRLSLFPFVVILSFFLFSMTEAMFGLVGNGITIAFFHVTGIILFTVGRK